VGDLGALRRGGRSSSPDKSGSYRGERDGGSRDDGARGGLQLAGFAMLGYALWLD